MDSVEEADSGEAVESESVNTDEDIAAVAEVEAIEAEVKDEA